MDIVARLDLLQCLKQWGCLRWLARMGRYGNLLNYLLLGSFVLPSDIVCNVFVLFAFTNAIQIIFLGC